MNRLFPCVLLLIGVLPIVSCDRSPTIAPVTPIPEPVAKTNTLETSRLAAAIDDFEREPTPVRSAVVGKAMAELDGEIAELQERLAKTTGNDRAEAEAKLRNLQTYRETQSARFKMMQLREGAGIAPLPDARTGAEKVEDSARKAGERVEDGAKKTGEAVKDAAEKVGDAIKDAPK